jgi:hypothetical protein
VSTALTSITATKIANKRRETMADDTGRQPTSEAAERAWASNDKARFDDLIAHQKRVDQIAEQSLQNAVDFALKANNAYLEQANAQNKAALALSENLNHQIVENNRFTLDRLYGVFPEEAVGIATMLSGFAEYLKSAGWTPPATDK